MEIRDLQEKYNEAKSEAMGYESNEMQDLELAFWDMIKELLDESKIVYNKSSQSEAVYIECVTEMDEDGEIEDFYTVRVATHQNGNVQDVDYIERDFEDMYHRLEELLQTQQGIYCEWEAPQKSIDELLAELKN